MKCSHFHILPHRNTISGQLQALLLFALLASALLFSFAIYMYGHYDDRSSNEAANFRDFGAFITYVGSLRDNIYDVQLQRTADSCAACRTSADDMYEISKKLAKNYPVRSMIDLSYHADTLKDSVYRFTENEGNFDETNFATYYSVNYTLSLLEERYSGTMNEMLQLYEARRAKIEHEQALFLRTAIIVLGIFLLFMLQMTRRIARYLAEPIETLANAASMINLYRLPDEAELPQERYNNETDILTASFREMIVRLQNQLCVKEKNLELERQVKDRELQNIRIEAELQENKFRMLRMQINPHFLFNALNSISASATCENAYVSRDLCIHFSEYLRYILKDTKTVVTVCEEIENIQNYLYIQKARYGDIIHADIDADEASLHLPFPSMILQPLVENCFVHGFRERQLSEGGCYLCVNIRIRSGRLEITVCDNGSGITPEKLDELNHLLEQPPAQLSIGVSSVLMRLKTFAKDSIQYSFSSIPNEYTDISISIPIERSPIH